jgi:hypothetical protein
MHGIICWVKTMRVFVPGSITITTMKRHDKSGHTWQEVLFRLLCPLTKEGGNWVSFLHSSVEQHPHVLKYHIEYMQALKWKKDIQG